MPLVAQERENLLESMRKYLIEKAANKGDRFEAATRMAQLLMCIPKIQVKFFKLIYFFFFAESSQFQEGIHLRK